MKTTIRSAEPGLAAARELCAQMQGRILSPGDRDYDDVRRIWNGAVDHYPALLAFCETPEDVQAAVRCARKHRFALSVRGGGHDWAGRAVRHRGLVIDLSKMRGIEIDAPTRVATVMGGARAKDLIAAAAPHGLTAVTGNCGSVGMAGLTLGGGYGLLSPRHGLALDNLLGAELVLADGRRVTADASENADLFWALRGGGGNFGVVTALRVQLHPVGELLAGMMLFPESETQAVLRGYGAIMASAPDELGMIAGVLSGPDGAPAAFLAPTWSGRPDEGAMVMAALRRLGTPIFERIGAMTFADLLGMFDAQIVDGRHYTIQTRWLADLTPGAISTLVGAAGARTSPFSVIALHHFHGAPSRVPWDATAFGLRRPHFLVEFLAAWEGGGEDDGTAHHRWARTWSQTLAPCALPGGYPNLLGPDDHDQIALAYGINTARLRDVKRRFDPDDVFRAIPLPPRP